MTFIAAEMLIHLLKAFAIDIIAACDKRDSPTMYLAAAGTYKCVHACIYVC